MIFFAKPIFIRLISLLVCSVLLFLSCKKVETCGDCRENNRPPIAIAGGDIVVILPTDTVALDGSASKDPDGTISGWHWVKVSGPVAFLISSPSSAKTVIKNLDTGIYRLELKVTDDGGLSAKDTLLIMVNSAPTVNHPPIANAGPDQLITLPENTVALDGSGSADPDNNIANHYWAKISGPSSFGIIDANLIRTQVTNLTAGLYQFELTITDGGGWLAKDTMQITVLPEPVVTPECNNDNRPHVNAQLTPFATLSHPRLGMAAASAGNKIVFAGASLSAINGSPFFDYGSSRVDIYDVVTQTWSTAELSEWRSDVAAVASGNKIFFAGGRLGDGANDQLFSTVDIYDAVSNSWSVAALSQPRAYISAAAIGNKVLFAGGEKDWNYNTSAVVDIYDISTNAWSTSTLSEARSFVSGVAAGDKIYLAGGHKEDRWYAEPSGKIDIYNVGNNTWSVSYLTAHSGSVRGIYVTDKIYWSGACTVEVLNTVTGNSQIAYLSQPNTACILEKNGKIIFIGAGNAFDIYETATNTWSIGVLADNIPRDAAIIAVNNTIYVAGGWANGTYTNISNKVWKLEF